MKTKLTTKNKLKAFIILAFVLVMTAYFILVMAVMSAGSRNNDQMTLYLPVILQNRCLEASCNHDPILEPEVKQP